MNVLYRFELEFAMVASLPQLVVYAAGSAGRGTDALAEMPCRAFVPLAPAGCASVAAGTRQAPNAPYQQGDPRDTSGLARRPDTGACVYLVIEPHEGSGAGAP